MDLFEKMNNLSNLLYNEQYEKNRLQMENDFLLRWINSRVNDEFKND